MISDAEDIIRRKQLAIASMCTLQKTWIRKDHISEICRLKQYKTLVKPVLTYNCSTWGVTKLDEDQLDTFQRKQLRTIINMKYPNRISNINLYKRCNDYPLSLFILKSRWKLFGHILRRNEQCPANNAMKFYFEETCKRGGGGGGRLVAMAKACLEKTVRFKTLTLVELQTLVFEIEATLNNRPMSTCGRGY